MEKEFIKWIGIWWAVISAVLYIFAEIIFKNSPDPREKAEKTIRTLLIGIFIMLILMFGLVPTGHF